MTALTLARGAVLVVSLAASLAGVVAWVATGHLVATSATSWLFSLMTTLAGTTWWAVGTVIVLRAHAPRVGWALMLGGLFGGLGMVAYAVLEPALIYGAPIDELDVWAFIVISLIYGPWFMSLIMGSTLLFPDGRLPGPRWRLPVATTIAAVLVSGFCRAFAPGPLFQGFPPNPIGIDALRVIPLDVIAILDPLGIAVLALMGLAALAVRFRRAARTERQQLKWLLLAVIPVALATPGSFFESDQQSNSLADVISAAGLFLLMPASIGLAVLRYRLYAIDRLISRGLSWGLLTGVLIAIYASGVLLLQGVLSGVTQGQTLAVAASTLVAAAVFQPLRRRIQHLVDRRFDRTRIDAQETVDAFAEDVRDHVDLMTLQTALTGTAGGSLRPLFVELWLRPEARR